MSREHEGSLGRSNIAAVQTIIVIFGLRGRVLHPILSGGYSKSETYWECCWKRTDVDCFVRALFWKWLCYCLAKALLEMENMPIAVRARCNCQFAIPASLRIKKPLTMVIQTEVISIDNYCMDWRVTPIRALKMWSTSPRTHSYGLFCWAVLVETENSCWWCGVGRDHSGIILDGFVVGLFQCTF